ncbi:MULTISPECIES: ATP-binding protein [Frankia]|uniref:ATP-binding protein n=1 Tax=Frankia TaxID=1854 RepID=UPI000688BCC6|nr:MULTISPECIES: ATP-binding protein [Frankia]
MTPTGSAHIRLFHFPVSDTAARAARSRARETIESWHIDPETTDNAVLLVSELITNAVRASTTVAASLDPSEVPRQERAMASVSLRISRMGSRLLLEVWDRDVRPPALQDQTPTAESGRGLFLVDALSAQWSWYRPVTGGKVVWVELRTAPSPTPHEQFVQADPGPPESLARRTRTAVPDAPFPVTFIDDPMLLRRAVEGLRKLDDRQRVHVGGLPIRPNRRDDPGCDHEGLGVSVISSSGSRRAVPLG